MLKILKVLRADTKSSIKQYFLDNSLLKHDITGPWNLHYVAAPRLKFESSVST